MSEPLLKVEGLEAGYGEVQVLWGVSLAAAVPPALKKRKASR
jgi:ABC-type branched-subunit amino acid transport system ATPase component